MKEGMKQRMVWLESEQVFSESEDTEGAVSYGKAERFQFSTLSETATRLLSRRLDMHLVALDLVFVRDSVFAAMREVITNAVRANAKAFYLKSQNITADLEDEYRTAMKSFKAFFVDRLHVLGDQLLREGLVVTVTLCHDDKGLTLTMENNRPLYPQEKYRIDRRLEEGRNYRDLAEAFKVRGDDTEGAGIGLIMTLMMLKADGISAEHLTLNSNGSSTMFSLQIRREELRRHGAGLKKAEPIVQKIDSLPSFPKTISDIQSLLKNPDSSLAQISQAVKKDPGLSGNLLKLANSAAFRRGNPVDNLDRAISLIGMKDLGDILYTLGTRQVMERHFPSYQWIADRSQTCAYLAKQIAIRMGLSKEAIGHVLSAALLHDIGEIILMSMERTAMMKIRGWAESKALSTCLTLEEAAFGITHTRLSGLLAEKWEFPEIYAAAMEYHHRPMLVPERYRETVWPIYLADRAVQSENRASWSDIPFAVLRACGFENLETFATVTDGYRKTLVSEGV